MNRTPLSELFNQCYPATLVKVYPRYRIMERSKDKRGRIHLAAFEQLIDRKTMLTTYEICSVISYALSDGRDPIAALEREKSLREAQGEYGGSEYKLHWINANSVCISNSPQAQEDVILIGHGDRVVFEGLEFEVENAPNNNFNLKEIGNANHY